jgi:hypothetical protein
VADSSYESTWQRLWQRLKRKLVQEVPEEMCACEYDCRKPDCRNGDWESCQRRLSYKP